MSVACSEEVDRAQVVKINGGSNYFAIAKWRCHERPFQRRVERQTAADYGLIFSFKGTYYLANQSRIFVKPTAIATVTAKPRRK